MRGAGRVEVAFEDHLLCLALVGLLGVRGQRFAGQGGCSGGPSAIANRVHLQ